MSVKSVVCCDGPSCGVVISRAEDGFVFTGDVLTAPVNERGEYDSNGARGGLIGSCKRADGPIGSIRTFTYCKVCTRRILGI